MPLERVFGLHFVYIYIYMYNIILYISLGLKPTSRDLSEEEVSPWKSQLVNFGCFPRMGLEIIKVNWLGWFVDVGWWEGCGLHVVLGEPRMAYMS